MKITKTSQGLLVFMGLCILLFNISCNGKDKVVDPEFMYGSHDMFFRNCDGVNYEAFIDGQPMGAIPENPDPSKCYPYSYGMSSTIEVVDTFEYSNMNQVRFHMLDIRLNGVIQDTWEFPIVSREDKHSELCIVDHELVGFSYNHGCD